MAGTLTVTGLAAGLASGQKIIGPLTITGGAVVGSIADLALTSGDNTVAVPSTASAFVIVMPSGNATQVKLRSNLNSGDTGFLLGLTGYTAGSLAVGTTVLILNSAGSVPGVEVSFI